MSTLRPSAPEFKPNQDLHSCSKHVLVPTSAATGQPSVASSELPTGLIEGSPIDSGLSGTEANAGTQQVASCEEADVIFSLGAYVSDATGTLPEIPAPLQTQPQSDGLFLEGADTQLHTATRSSSIRFVSEQYFNNLLQSFEMKDFQAGMSKILQGIDNGDAAGIDPDLPDVLFLPLKFTLGSLIYSVPARSEEPLREAHHTACTMLEVDPLKFESTLSGSRRLRLHKTLAQLSLEAGATIVLKRIPPPVVNDFEGTPVPPRRRIVGKCSGFGSSSATALTHRGTPMPTPVNTPTESAEETDSE